MTVVTNGGYRSFSDVAFHFEEEEIGRDIRRMFSRYLSEDAMKSLAAAPSSPVRKMENKKVHFLLFQIRDDQLGDTRNLMTEAIAIVVGSGGVLECVMSSIALVTFGLYSREKRAPAELQSGLADALIEKLGSEIRIAYGCAEGLHGTIGTDTRFLCMPLLPGLSSYMEKLMKTNFGISVKVGEIAPLLAAARLCSRSADQDLA